MDFLIFYKEWIFTLLKGWINILKFLYRLILEIIKKFPYSFWLLNVSSILLIIMLILPWFSYDIQLNNREIIYLRTKKWYIFMIPGVTSVFFTMIYHSKLYKIQLGINLMTICLYLYGLFNKEYHILVKGDYKILLWFYLYFLVLILHTLAINALKRNDNFLYNQLIILWKTKIKNNL